jgi:hypothetical protein
MDRIVEACWETPLLLALDRRWMARAIAFCASALPMVLSGGSRRLSSTGYPI